ncbi:MAG TPA: TonB family protein [Vicinamibacterales bacterium]|nr:TonB family protein [Vicinamibacterales bacterium]
MPSASGDTDLDSASWYSPREIASAAGVSEAEVLAALQTVPRTPRGYVRHADAVRVGRALAKARFSIFTDRGRQRWATALPLAISSTLHGGVFLVAVFVATLGLTPTRATGVLDRSEPMRLVFLAVPGPGGGGGGGGLRQKARPPKAEQKGHQTLSSPVEARIPPPIETPPKPPEPEPEPPPVIEAPVASVAADDRTKPGVLEEPAPTTDTQGPGAGGGVGTGLGAGIGEGNGAGIGDGSGGGTGGGVYRPGSGIEPPRLLHEVKPDYTEDARRQRLEGEVTMEIVVQRDGTVGDLTIIRGLGGGLNERAVRAVRQWRFSPARRRGVPVDVIVEVAVDFKLR